MWYIFACWGLVVSHFYEVFWRGAFVSSDGLSWESGGAPPGQSARNHTLVAFESKTTRNVQGWLRILLELALPWDGPSLLLNLAGLAAKGLATQCNPRYVYERAR